jgi:molybdopterin-binding protein
MSLGIQARFQLDYPGFTLDVDLERCRAAASPRCSAIPVRARPRCCAASPGWNARPAASLRGQWRGLAGRRHFLPTHRRPLGYVFQEASLFPAPERASGNLDYGMKRVGQRPGRAALDQAIIELLGIGHLLERKPDQPLRRRAPARRHRPRPADVSPRLLLMDEPLAALDLASARTKSCPTWNGCTTNWTFPCSTSAMRRTRWRGWPTLVRVRVHARDVSLALDEPGASSILNILPARILEMREIEQAQVLVKLCTGAGEKTPLLARITRHSRDRLQLQEGQTVFAQVKAVALMD